MNNEDVAEVGEGIGNLSLLTYLMLYLYRNEIEDAGG